jgi:hypothetical protein
MMQSPLTILAEAQRRYYERSAVRARRDLGTADTPTEEEINPFHRIGSYVRRAGALVDIELVFRSRSGPEPYRPHPTPERARLTTRPGNAPVDELPPVTSLVTRLCSFKGFRTQKQGQSGTEAILIRFLGSDRKEFELLSIAISACQEPVGFNQGHSPRGAKEKGIASSIYQDADGRNDQNTLACFPLAFAIRQPNCWSQIKKLGNTPGERAE